MFPALEYRQTTIPLDARSDRLDNGRVPRQLSKKSFKILRSYIMERTRLATSRMLKKNSENRPLTSKAQNCAHVFGVTYIAARP